MTKIPALEILPAAKKAGKLYSLIPANGEGDFTFSRNRAATFTNKDGYLETAAIDVPRLDYRNTDGGLLKCPQLLLEGASTNYLRFSEDFSASTYYVKNSSSYTLTANSSIAPDGKNTASLFEFTASITSAGMFTGTGNRPTIVGAGEVWTSSIFARYIDGTNSLRINFGGSGFSGQNVIFNIEDGTITSESSATGKIEDYGNGWFRCSATATSIGAGILTPAFYADTTSQLGNRYYWGAQTEAMGYPTSYISTTSSVITRGADVCNGAGTVDTFNSTEGVLYVEIKALSDDLTNREISISDSTTSNTVLVRYDAVSQRIIALCTVAGVIEANINTVALTITDFHKIAFKWKLNDFALWIDGNEIGTDVSGNVFSINTLTEFAFDNGGGTANFVGRIKGARVYNTALTDTELAELTT